MKEHFSKTVAIGGAVLTVNELQGDHLKIEGIRTGTEPGQFKHSAIILTWPAVAQLAAALKEYVEKKMNENPHK